MSKLLSSREVVTALVREGFVFVFQKGSHAKYRKVSGSETFTVIVPDGKREIPIGTLRSIMRQSHLGREKL